MGDKSKIEWTDSTWNPVTGCSKVSAGCKNCYAERVFNRVYGRELTECVDSDGEEDLRRRKFTDVVCYQERLDIPLRWKRPRRIFVNSMSDLFHEDIPYQFIASVFETMARAYWHTFQVLTKRPLRMKACVETFMDDQKLILPLGNVWLGASMEDQKTADKRIPILLDTPADVRFVSYEPALGPVSLMRYLDPDRGCQWADASALSSSRKNKLDWVIAGGESGHKARPAHPDWFRCVRNECVKGRVPFFFKQWGEWGDFDSANKCWSKITAIHAWPPPNDGVSYRIGKKRAGRLLDWREWNEFPLVGGPAYA